MAKQRLPLWVSLSEWLGVIGDKHESTNDSYGGRAGRSRPLPHNGLIRLATRRATLLSNLGYQLTPSVLRNIASV